MMTSPITLHITLYKIALKVTRIFSYFARIFSQDVLKIAQSGHTVIDDDYVVPRHVKGGNRYFKTFAVCLTTLVVLIWDNHGLFFVYFRLFTVSKCHYLRLIHKMLKPIWSEESSCTNYYSFAQHSPRLFICPVWPDGKIIFMARPFMSMEICPIA